MGVSFADDSVPGVDLIMPDAGFIIDKKEDLLWNCFNPCPRGSYRRGYLHMAELKV